MRRMTMRLPPNALQPGPRALVAIHASRGPGRWVVRHHMSLRTLTLLMSVALLVVGCRSEKLSAGFHRAGSSEFTTDEAKAVETAKTQLEKAGGKRIDARYKVTRLPEGFSVHVEYVTGYEHGQPVFIPGGFCVILVSTQWTVIKILGGA